ncbi:MAG: hypothetical protein ACR2MT_16980 [Aurantibacter sp.]
MNNEFEAYRSRIIEFRKLVKIGDWNVKMYSITKKDKFESYETLERIETELPNMLYEAQLSDLPTHKMAFAMAHEAREGVLILLCWWTGGEMVETKIFFSDYSTPDKIEPSPFKDKALVCIWELEVFAHERKAWIDHVLSKATDPDIDAYLGSYLMQEV